MEKVSMSTPIMDTSDTFPFYEELLKCIFQFLFTSFGKIFPSSPYFLESLANAESQLRNNLKLTQKNSELKKLLASLSFNLSNIALKNSDTIENIIYQRPQPVLKKQKSEEHQQENNSKSTKESSPRTSNTNLVTDQKTIHSDSNDAFLEDICLNESPNNRPSTLKIKPFDTQANRNLIELLIKSEYSLSASDVYSYIKRLPLKNNPSTFYTSNSIIYPTSPNTNNSSPSLLAKIKLSINFPSSERYIFKDHITGIAEWDELDKYHDENDPGYRIRDLYESEHPILPFNIKSHFEGKTLNSPYIGFFNLKNSPPSFMRSFQSGKGDLNIFHRPDSVKVAPQDQAIPTFGISYFDEEVEEDKFDKQPLSSTNFHENFHSIPDEETNSSVPHFGTYNERESFIKTDSPLFKASTSVNVDQINDSSSHQQNQTDIIFSHHYGYSNWDKEFEIGDFQTYRKKKREQLRKIYESSSNMSQHHFPLSFDPVYPLKVTNSFHEPTIFDAFNLRVIFERYRTGIAGDDDLFLPLGSKVAGRYCVECPLGEAAFSRAFQCKDLLTDKRVCMKVIKNNKEYVDQSLDEIMLLRFINANGDPDSLHFLRLYDYFYYRSHLIIITERLHENLYEISKFCKEQNLPNFFTLGRLQRISHQVLVSLQFIHSLHLIHCDLKPENILLYEVYSCAVKIIDFGSSRFDYDSLTTYVQSRPYRAPECLLGLPYSEKIDIWSLGCILAELWTGYILFQGHSVHGLLARQAGIVGPFPDYMFIRGVSVPSLFTDDGYIYQFTREEELSTYDGGRHYCLLFPKQSNLFQRLRCHDTLFVDFISKLLTIDPTERLSASEALKHPWLYPGRYIDGI